MEPTTSAPPVAEEIGADMLTRVGAAARRNNLSFEDFQQHWVEQHGPTAGSIPNLVRYVQHHAVLSGGVPVLPYPGFDACSELDFDSLAAMDDGFAQAAATGELKADEDRFVDKERYSWVLGEADVRLATTPPAEPVTLVSWWRAHPSSSAERLVEVLTGSWEDALAESVASPIAGRRLIVARRDWHRGRPDPTADAVEVIVFDGIDCARDFVVDTVSRIGTIVAGVAFGVERHLAVPVVVSPGPVGPGY